MTCRKRSVAALVVAAASLGLSACSGSSPSTAQPPKRPVAPSAHTQAALACERAQNTQVSLAARSQAALPYAEAAAAHDPGYRTLLTVLQQLSSTGGPQAPDAARSASLQAQLAAACSQALQP